MNRFFQPSIARFFGFVLISIVLYVIYQRLRSNSMTLHHQIDEFKDSSAPTEEELESANTNYAALLLFLQKYPEKSIPFIKDMKDKLYGGECTVKPSIDFKNIAKFPNGMVFV